MLVTHLIMNEAGQLELINKFSKVAGWIEVCDNLNIFLNFMPKPKNRLG